MQLTDLPLTFALIGLALYTVLGGADFGAGLWQLTAGAGPGAARIRDHAHHAMAPVWEANHVWLIFVLTVVWTAYPSAFGAIASTLTVPLFVAAIGIIFRGAGYALRSGTSQPRQLRVIDIVFALSSILTPFALGAAAGGIASRRVPVGNATGNLLTSWFNPTSILVGVLAVAVGAFVAAVYLSADAVRLAQPDLERAFRARALGAGALTGAIALGALAVLRVDAPALYLGLVTGDGLAGLIASILAGVTTLVLVWRRRFTVARGTAALAVAAIIAGWALAQRPVFLPGLTVAQAAAPRDTLIAVVVAVLAGAVILFPSLALLFRLVLRGGFDPGRQPPTPPRQATQPVSRSRLAARLAGACLVAGIGLLTIAEAGWAHAVGVLALFGFIALAFLAFAPADIAAEPTDDRQTSSPR
ncbi:MAG: cytochrome d ubiquinol oxidase subunit II [Pseudonocardiaceae bacterium]